jgi:hypothetical protein
VRALEFDQIALHRFPDEAREYILFEAFEKPFTGGSLEDLERGPIEDVTTVWVVFESQEEIDQLWDARCHASHPRI